MSNTMTGTVKWFNDDKGFGFIHLKMVAKMYLFTFQQFKAIALNH